MAEKSQYLEIMKQGLEKKIEFLNQLVIKNAEQATIIQEEEMDMEAFDRNVELKAEIIEQLEKLDEGFENVYERMREELLSNRHLYQNEIAVIKKLISDITDRSMSIEAAEMRNKQGIEKHFSMLRKNVRDTKVSSKAAANYYRSMSNSHVVESQNIDVRTKF